MIIQDYNSTWDVTKPADIEAALSKRHGAGVNSFWLGYVAGGFPAINILVKGDIAQVHYFPNEDHPGFSSVGRCRLGSGWIWCGAFSGNMRVSFQAARSIG